VTVLTLKQIHNLPPGTEVAIDAACAGLVVRVSARGNRTWAYRYRANGVLRRMTIGLVPATPTAKPYETSLGAARADYYRLRAERDKVGDPLERKRERKRLELAAARDKQLTVQKAADGFLAAQARRLGPRTLKEYRRQLRKHVALLGSAEPLASITRDVLYAKIVAPYKLAGRNVMANRATATLKAWLSWCEAEYSIESAAVRLKIDRHVENPRDRVLTENELRAFWRATEGGDQRMQCLRLVLVTGLRPGEAAGLHRQWIDSDRLTVPKTKNGQAHTLPLSPVAKAILAAVPSRPDGLVFGVKVGDLSHRIKAMTGERQAQTAARKAKLLAPATDRKKPPGAMRKIRALEGCAPFRPHDLRRTALTTLARLGCPLEVIQRIANHAPTGVTQKVYLRHSYEGEMRDWLIALGAFIDGLGTGTVASLEEARATRGIAA